MIIAEINLKIIRENIRTLRKRLSKNVKICAVVKANAYSLGDVPISRAIERDVAMFAVAHLSEAKRLRENEIALPILLFGVCEDYKEALRLGLITSINSVAEIRELAKATKSQNSQAVCHIKVNTGLNRYGITTMWQLRKIIEIAIENGITVEGLYTHFAFEEDNLDRVDKQLERFKPFRKLYKKYFPKGIIHAACAGTAHYHPAQFDMVRVGKNLYGGYHGYKTAITIRAKIVAVQNIKKGEIVGYGGTFIAKNNMRVGIINCGYADIAHTSMSNNGYVLVNNKPCKILGRICMDSFMIDASEIDNAIGKEVLIIADKDPITLVEVVTTNKLVTCDLLCGFNFNRAKLIYKK